MSVPQSQFGPQAGQPQQPHPTVPYGQEFGPPQQPMQQPRQMQPQQPQFQPGQMAPHPTVPYGPGQMGPQQQPQAPAGIDPNTILDGPGVPQELRGRRIGQVMQIYSALADDWARRQQMNASGGTLPPREPQYQPPQQPGQPQPQMQPNPRPQQPAQQPQQARPDWRDEVRSIVSEVVAPVVQTTQATTINQAKDMARMTVQDFNELEPEIMQVLSSAPPQALTNPAIWESTADMVRGRRQRLSMGARPGMLPTQAAPQFGLRPSVPANQAPLPVHSFFTEGPTPPMTPDMRFGTLTPEEMHYAKKMGMTPEEYIGWRGGVVR